MPLDKAPAFQFYPKDFLTDEKVVLMSNTELGVYIRLLSFCWLEGTLPLEMESLARMARLPLKQFTKLWERSVLRSCFQMRDDGRLHHKRLDTEREKQEHYRQRQSEKGRSSAHVKKLKELHRADHAGCLPVDVWLQPNVNRTSTNTQRPVQPEVNSSSPISNLQIEEPPVVPLSAKGGRVTRHDLHLAEQVVKNRLGCTHEPRCPTHQACVRMVAEEIRGKAS